MSNSEPHAYQTAFSYRNTLFYRTTTANKAASSNRDITVENGTGGNVAVVFHCGVVFNQCTSINDTVVAHPGTRIDDNAMHNDGADANNGVP